MSSQEDRDQLKQILQAVLAEGGIVPATQPPPAATKVEEASVPWWVKIFGSAIVVILASVLIGIIQNLHATIHDVNNKVVVKEEFNAVKSQHWMMIRECQEKTGKLLAAEERLRLSEDRIKKLEADAALLREAVTRMEEQLKAHKGVKGAE